MGVSLRAFEHLVSPTDMALLHDFVAFMRNGSGRPLREDTICNYLKGVATFIRRAQLPGGASLVSLITKSQLLCVLHQIDHVQVSGRRNLVFAIKALARFLGEMGYVSPAVVTPITELAFKGRAKPTRAVVEAEAFSTLLAHVRASPHYDTVERATLFAILALLSSTGLRNSELCKLRQQDVDFEQGLIRVVEGKGGKERWVGLPHRTVPALQYYLRHRPASPHEHFFVGPTGRPLTRDLLIKRFARLSRATGIKVSAHMFRRTFATTVAHRGIPLDKLQVVLGHADIQTTRLYVQTAPLAVAQEMRAW